MQTDKINSDEVKIRQAVLSDVEALALLIAEPGFDYPTETFLVGERLIDLNNAGDCLLVATYKEKIIGMVLLHQTRFLHRKPDGRISALVVSELFRGNGVGASLVKEAESLFRKWGCGRIEVSSGATRKRAHSFYNQLGFTEQPKRFIKLLHNSY